MVSIIILTKNEELNLEECIKTLSWSNDIHVFDSQSTDKTLSIAKKYDANIIVKEFTNWSEHQNWALKNINFKYPWVFYIDADERMTPELIQSVQLAVMNPGDKVAFRVQRRDYFMGTWIKHVQASAFYLRLFRPEKMRYERLVNPISIPSGPVDTISGYLDHFPFSKGIGHWIDRHNSYSLFEAQQILSNRQQQADFSMIKAFTSGDFNERRFHQKELFYRLPFRPLVKFLILYFGKLGFLDGRAGFTYAMLQSIYEYFIVLKTRELERDNKD